jgi:ABC-type branched-subunit amino acid transport system substrate-binding protein
VNKQGQVVNAQGEVLGSAEEFGLSGGSVSDGSASGSGNTTSGGSSGPPRGTSGRVDSSAPGVTATSIRLGLPVVEGFNTGSRGLAGGNSPTGVNYRAAWEALVKDINERGGIAGHKVDPVYHSVDLVSSKTTDQRANEACAAWTEDKQVFAALVHQIETESMIACIEEGGAATVSGQTVRAYYDERVFTRYPHFLVPFGIDLNTQATAMIENLVKQKYFGSGAKIGLVTFDHPSFKYATEKSLIPALSRRGLELSDTAALHFPTTYSEYSQLSSEASNAALRFKTNGITHVVILDLGQNAAYFFMQAAERQAYRPRYGLTSQSANSGLASQLGPADARAQLQGARSIGWVPIVDTVPADDPHAEGYPPRKRCTDLMRKHGVEMTSRNAEGQALNLCGQLWFTEAALEITGNAISLDSLLAGVDRLGSSFAPTNVFLTRMSKTIHDGSGAVASMSFIDECACFRYTSRPYSIPD